MAVHPHTVGGVTEEIIGRLLSIFPAADSLGLMCFPQFEKYTIIQQTFTVLLLKIIALQLHEFAEF